MFKNPLKLSVKMLWLDVEVLAGEILKGPSG